MSITATEFKQNLGKYLLLSNEEDIYITKNGKVIALICNPDPSRRRKNALDMLRGCLPSDIDADLDEIREERLARI